MSHLLKDNQVVQVEEESFDDWKSYTSTTRLEVNKNDIPSRTYLHHLVQVHTLVTTPTVDCSHLEYCLHTMCMCYYPLCV